MKVIFLDVDGVLNSEEFFVERTQDCRYDEYRKAGYSPHLARQMCSLDSIAIAKLNYLISQTGAKIVVSSCWRADDPELQELFAIVGIPAYIDITPYHETRHRGTEVQQWLNKHPEVENYVIIDDDNDMLDSQLNNFVQTNAYKRGLSDEDVELAIQILNGKRGS